MLSRRVHVERTIFHSLSLNPLLSGCLSATAQAILRVAHAWVALAASLQHGHRAPRWSSPRLPLRRSSSSSRVFSSSLRSPLRAERGSGARGGERRAPVVGVVRCVGIAAWGSSWPQEEEPRGRAAGAQRRAAGLPRQLILVTADFLLFSEPPNSPAAPATEIRTSD